VESFPEVIFVEQNGHIVYMNPSGLSLLGYDSLSEVEGKKLSSLISGFSTMNVGIPSNTEAKFIRKDGTLFDVEVTFFETTYQGETATQGLARDITESKNLRIAAQRMERLAALGELSATLAHEIRNSLGSISLNFRNLVDHLEIPEPYQRTFKNIELGIQKIQEIMNGILNFARPVQPTLKLVDIRKVIESSLHGVEKELESSDIKIERKYEDQIPELLLDPGQIHQVFVNLYLNAKQAMQFGGTLIVEAAARTDVVEVIVEDTGKGIPPENLEKIFNPFFTTRSEGIGLGLAIVSRILEQHKSQIFVTSESGSGTRFTIRFPLHAPETPTQRTEQFVGFL
jgi:PAS domain S-box-containing protein